MRNAISARTRRTASAVIAGIMVLALTTRGSFVPGGDDDPFGTFTIDGVLDASRGMGLDILIGNNGQSSRLAVTGEALLAGEISVGIASHINPLIDYQPGDSFIIFTAGKLSTGAFDNVPWETPLYGDGATLPRGPKWILHKRWLADKQVWAAVLEVAGRADPAQ